MRRVTLVLFFGYVVLLIVAGAWGIAGARLDMRWVAIFTYMRPRVVAG